MQLTLIPLNLKALGHLVAFFKGHLDGRVLSSLSQKELGLAWITTILAYNLTSTKDR